MKKPIHPVTDHAVLRYLERVEGMDIETLRRRIGHTVQHGLEQGANGVISGGFVYRITDGVVVTVTAHSRIEIGHKKRRGRKPRG